MIFWRGLVFGICRSRAKFLIRWIPSLYFLTVSINVIICALNVSPTYSKGISADDLFYVLQSNFIYASMILTQSDAKNALLTQSPVWFITAFIVKKKSWVDN